MNRHQEERFELKPEDQPAPYKAEDATYFIEVNSGEVWREAPDGSRGFYDAEERGWVRVDEWRDQVAEGELDFEPITLRVFRGVYASWGVLFSLGFESGFSLRGQTVTVN